jgi:hypothetical protein
MPAKAMGMLMKEIRSGLTRARASAAARALAQPALRVARGRREDVGVVFGIRGRCQNVAVAR